MQCLVKSKESSLCLSGPVMFLTVIKTTIKVQTLLPGYTSCESISLYNARISGGGLCVPEEARYAKSGGVSALSFGNITVL